MKAHTELKHPPDMTNPAHERDSRPKPAPLREWDEDAFCRRWWKPLHASLCRRGMTPWDAEDLTQSFFEKLTRTGKLWWLAISPDPGRYLHAGLRRHWFNQARNAGRFRRGGGSVSVSLDAMEPGARSAVEPVDYLTPERVIHRNWALQVSEQAAQLVRSRWEQKGRLAEYDALQGTLGDDADINRRGAARCLGVTEGALRVRRLRLRREHIETVKAMLLAGDSRRFICDLLAA